MSLFLSKDEEAFKTKARDFAEDHVIPQANEVEAGKYPRELIRDMGRENLLGAPFSKSDGGQGLGWVSEGIVAEEISAANAPTEMSRATSPTRYALTLAYFGDNYPRKESPRPVYTR